MLPHLIFDFGGVVFRWRPEVVLANELPDRVTSPALAAHWKQLFFQGYAGDWGAFDNGEIEVPELVSRIVTRTGLSPREVQAVVDAIPLELEPQPGTVALMRQLKADGHRLFYLSNMPVPYACELERRHEFLSWFDDGVFSGRVGMGKPGASVFELALARFGIQRHEALFIDDHPANVEAARSLGLPALWFISPERLASDLGAMGLATPRN
jgi:HAD superfamily hydrolase (TIGR01509 family)